MAYSIRILCLAAGTVVLCIAVWFRCWDLCRIPGVNGDEAWYGVQAERFLHGECTSARTPTGNPLNPFFMGPQVLLHALWAPSFTLLRVPALVSGLAALALNFVLCRRAFGWRLAWLTTLIHAVLPINIAYSRFAWDASQSLLFTLPVVYAAVLAYQEPARRARWTAIGLFSLAAAMLVHPTNAFVGALFAMLTAAAWRDRLAAWWQAAVVRRIGLPLLIVAVVAAAAPLLPRVLANIRATDNYTAFARRFGDLFTGATVYEYISGSSIATNGAATSRESTQIALEWLAVSVAGLAAFALKNLIRRGRSALDAWLLAGWAASVACFFVVAGPGAIAPHFERYAICLVAPTVLLLARSFHWWMQPTTRFSAATGPLLVALAGCMLATFKSHYFDEFHQSGGRSHLTFRTAAVEPKQQAMERIASPRPPNGPVLIQTSEWWLYWPLRYLAYGHTDVSVELRSADDPRPLQEQACQNVETWIVEFADEPAAWRLRKALVGTAGHYRIQKSLIHDAADENLLLLLKLPAK